MPISKKELSITSWWKNKTATLCGRRSIWWWVVSGQFEHLIASKFEDGGVPAFAERLLFVLAIELNGNEPVFESDVAREIPELKFEPRDNQIVRGLEGFPTSISPALTTVHHL